MQKISAQVGNVCLAANRKAKRERTSFGSSFIRPRMAWMSGTTWKTCTRSSATHAVKLPQRAHKRQRKVLLCIGALRFWPAARTVMVEVPHCVVQLFGGNCVVLNIPEPSVGSQLCPMMDCTSCVMGRVTLDVSPDRGQVGIASAREGFLLPFSSELLC